MCITEYNEAQHLETVKQEGREEGREEGWANVLDVQDYIIGNPDKTDAEIAEKFSCKESLVNEARKRIVR